jgi:hypothetical protein
LEPVKESLVREVQALQAQTDDAMVHVAEKRRTVPARWTEAWQAQAAAATASPAAATWPAEPAPDSATGAPVHVPSSAGGGGRLIHLYLGRSLSLCVCV